MKPTKKKPARVEARVMYVNDAAYEANLSTAMLYRDAPTKKEMRAYKLSALSIIPRDPASQAAMVEQGAKALFAYCVAPWSLADRGHREHYREYARVVLASVGLVEAKP